MKRFQKITVSFLTLAVLITLTSCGGGKMYKRPNGVTPDMAKDNFIIMPVDLHIKGDKLKLSAALFGGFLAAFGKQGVSLQPIKPLLERMGLGNLSWQMAHGMYHMVSVHGTYDFKKDGTYHGGNSQLMKIVGQAAKLVGMAAQKLKLNFKPKFLVTAHVDGTSSSIPKMYGYRALVGLYNIESGMVEKVAYQNYTCADNEAAILADMASLGSKLHKMLGK